MKWEDVIDCNGNEWNTLYNSCRYPPTQCNNCGSRLRWVVRNGWYHHATVAHILVPSTRMQVQCTSCDWKKWLPSHKRKGDIANGWISAPEKKYIPPPLTLRRVLRKLLFG